MLSWQPRYDCSEEEARKLAAQLVARRALGDKDSSIYLIEGDDPISNACRWLEEEVFWPKFHMSPQIMMEEYGDFESISRFIAVIKHDCRQRPQVAGVLRLIYGGEGGRLKTVEDIRKYWGLGADACVRQATNSCARTGDIATMVVHPQCRSLSVMEALCFGVHELSLRYNLEHWVCIVTKEHRRRFERLGLSMKDVGPPQAYLGTPDNVPVCLDVSSQAASIGQTSFDRSLLITGANSPVNEGYNVDRLLRRDAL